jgi:hypothetical protein
MAKHPDAEDVEAAFLDCLGKPGIKRVLDWLARFSLWVDPVVYKNRKIRIVYPNTRRKRSREKREEWVDGAKLWTNEPPQEAFFSAIGSKRSRYKNYNLCHLYEESAYLPKHYTNLANITVVPKSLASLTECFPVQEVLKWHSYQLFGYKGPNGKAPVKPPYYPPAWRGIKRLDSDTLATVLKDLKYRVTHKPHYTGKTNA